MKKNLSLQSIVKMHLLWLLLANLSLVQAQMVDALVPEIALSAKAKSASLARSEKIKIDSIKTIEIKGEELEVLQAKSANLFNGKNGQVPQIGVARHIPALKETLDFSEQLSWQINKDGSKTAALRFVSQDALAMRLILNVERISPRLKLQFSGDENQQDIVISGADIIDTLTRNELSDPEKKRNNHFVAPMTQGHASVLTLTLPALDDEKEMRLSIPSISHFFITPKQAEENAKSWMNSKNAAYCEINVSCESELAEVSRSVALLVFTDQNHSSFLCTGTLINNPQNNLTPYLLTANHCVNDQFKASSLQSVWLFKRQTCSNSSDLDSEAAVLTQGAQLLTFDKLTDTSLLRLNEAAPVGVIFAGWDATAQKMDSSIHVLHHPDGDVQKVSTGKIIGFQQCGAINSQFECAPSSADNALAGHLNVVFSSGVTEGGSSGAGLFVNVENKHYLTGVLSGGTSSCINPEGNDVFGRLDLAYQRVLHAWLSPKESGVETTRSPIYRFYNTQTYTHFFTINPNERDFVIEKLPLMIYEGPRFYAYTTSQANDEISSVFRFYNTQTYTHFFTINEIEKDLILKNYPLLRPEGNAWFARKTSSADSIALYRFYNTEADAHFYTQNESERDYVIQYLPKMSYEGIDHYVWDKP